MVLNYTHVDTLSVAFVVDLVACIFGTYRTLCCAILLCVPSMEFFNKLL